MKRVFGEHERKSSVILFGEHGRFFKYLLNSVLSGKNTCIRLFKEQDREDIKESPLVFTRTWLNA